MFEKLTSCKCPPFTMHLPPHCSFPTFDIFKWYPIIFNFCWPLEHFQTSPTIAFTRVDPCYPGLKFARWIKLENSISYHNISTFSTITHHPGKILDILLDSPFPNQQGKEKLVAIVIPDI